MAKSIILIGSSPIMVTEAAYRQKLGNDVLILEKNSEVGGAWKTAKYDNLPEIELGCHIWSYNKKSYKLLEALFNFKMVQLTPQPKIELKNKLIPYDWKSNILTLKASLGLDFWRTFWKNPSYRLSVFPAKFLYPSEGGKEICERVNSFILEKDLTVKCNDLVQKVVVNPEKIEIHTENSTYNCDQLILSSLSEINKFQINGEELIPETRKAEYIHVHLKIKLAGSAKNFSYIRLMSDSVIHRISDMTFQVKSELQENEVLYGVGIYAKAFYKYNMSELIDKISNTLINYNFITKNSQILAHNHNVYPSYYIPREFMATLEEKSDNRIKFLRSTDFVYSFYNRLEDYKSLLSHPE